MKGGKAYKPGLDLSVLLLYFFIMAWSLTQQQQHGNFFCSLALFFLSSCFLHLNICICWFNNVKLIAYYKIKRDAKEEEVKKINAWPDQIKSKRQSFCCVLDSYLFFLSQLALERTKKKNPSQNFNGQTWN